MCSQQIIDEVQQILKAYVSPEFGTQSPSSNISMNKMAMIEYLVDNVFVHVGKKVFRQKVGIPMGTDCAPLLANLYLFYYEYLYMKNLIKSVWLNGSLVQ